MSDTKYKRMTSQVWNCTIVLVTIHAVGTIMVPNKYGLNNSTHKTVKDIPLSEQQSCPHCYHKKTSVVHDC